MKKFFYLMAFVCTLGLFTACSSDDDPTPTIWDTYQGGNYSVWFDDLDTEDNDLYCDVVDMKMNVAKGDNNKAKVTITSEGLNITVPSAEIAQDGSTIKITGEGVAKAVKTKATDASNSMNCQINATIEGEKATLSITADGETITATSNEKSPLVGLWNMQPTQEVDGNFIGSVKLTWEVKEDCPPIMDFIPAAMAGSMGASIANQILPNVLKAVAFTSDGKIIAQYANLPSTSEESDDATTTTPSWLIAKDYATYQVVDNEHIKVFLNTDLITSTITDATSKATVETILGLFKEGIPVNIRWSNNNQTAYFYVDQEFATTMASSPVLAGIVENLGDDDVAGFGGMIKAIMTQMPELMENTTKFEAGLELVK